MIGAQVVGVLAERGERADGVGAASAHPPCAEQFGDASHLPRRRACGVISRAVGAGGGETKPLERVGSANALVRCCRYCGLA